MKASLLKSVLTTALALLMWVSSMQTNLWSDSVNSRNDRIVGVWDVQVTIFNCSTGAQLFTFRGLHKYELGGTAQVVPATNPTALSAHMGIWNHLEGNNYQLVFKMFRYDGAGNNIGWQIGRFNITTDGDATLYAGSGKAEVFDADGNLVGTSCPTLTGSRFQ